MIKKKVAVYEYFSPDCMKGVQGVCDYEPINNGRLRISEWIEVDFPERDQSEFLPDIVSGIDKEIEEIKEKLQTKKSELLALRHDEQ